jgi:tRNA dimethylallyltransferase
MDIGTGKPTPAEQAGARHHLIDILDPREQGSAGRHAAMAAAAVADIVARGRVPLLVGGTGLYFRAFFGGLLDVRIPPDVLSDIREGHRHRDTETLYEELRLGDPDRAAEIGPRDRVRIARALELMAWTGRPVSELYAAQRRAAERYDAVRVVLTLPRVALRDRIAERTRSMFAAGWEDEVRRLLGAGVPPDAPGMRSIGYGEIAGAVANGRGATSVADEVITRTQQYAKRQETFFRGERGSIWLDVSAEGWEEELRRHAGGAAQ